MKGSGRRLVLPAHEQRSACRAAGCNATLRALSGYSHYSQCQCQYTGGRRATHTVQQADRHVLGFLILLFIALPVLELVLLLRIGSWIGALPTILLVIATGVIGASLARSQGLAVLTRIQHDLAGGRPPVAQLVDGFLIFAAGVLLLTPGVITDAFGILLLLPPARALLRRLLSKRMQRMAQAGTARFTIMRGMPQPPPQTGASQRPQGRDVTDL